MPDARTPPKRTRRLSAPFDDRLEVRMYSTEKAKLQEEAKARGLSASDLARFQLGDLIDAPPPESIPEPQEPPCDLTAVIAEGLGCTVGHALLKLRLGKVTVQGKPWTAQEIDPSLLVAVEVDGLPLPQEAQDLV